MLRSHLWDSCFHCRLDRHVCPLFYGLNKEINKQAISVCIKLTYAAWYRSRRNDLLVTHILSWTAFYYCLPCTPKSKIWRLRSIRTAGGLKTVHYAQKCREGKCVESGDNCKSVCCRDFKFKTLKGRAAAGVTNLFPAGALRKLECDDSLCRIPICCHWTWQRFPPVPWTPRPLIPSIRMPVGMSRLDERFVCGCCLSLPRKCSPGRPQLLLCTQNTYSLYLELLRGMVYGLMLMRTVTGDTYDTHTSHAHVPQTHTSRTHIYHRHTHQAHIYHRHTSRAHITHTCIPTHTHTHITCTHIYVHISRVRNV
jgi:hypothetical protein